MAYAYQASDGWREPAGPFTIGEREDAVSYPAGWLDSATPEQRADLGAVEIVDEPAAADALRLTGPVLVDVDGVPHRRWVQPGIADVRAACRAQAAALRWGAQQRFKWRGRIVDADDATIGRITGAVLRAQVTGEQDATVQWKFGDNDFDTLTLADLTAYGIATAAHLQACYDREAELVGAINATVGVANLAAIDLTAGWPS